MTRVFAGTEIVYGEYFPFVKKLQPGFKDVAQTEEARELAEG